MNQYNQTARLIREADALLIGASNGFSITEGLHLFANNQAFHQVFGDFEQKYGVPSIIHGCMGRWPSEAEKWAFNSRLLKHYMLDYTVSPMMRDLKRLVGEKPHFILTTNGECHFTKAGFRPEDLYEIEGNWSMMQCAAACHSTLYPTEELAAEMDRQQSGCRVPEELVPKCPKCGGKMNLHVEIDHHFLPDPEPQRKFREFLDRFHGKKLVILELGVGDRNVIRSTFLHQVMVEPNCSYVTVNLDQLTIPPAVASKTIQFRDYLDRTLSLIAAE